MDQDARSTAIDAAARRLRRIAFENGDGALLGSEEALRARLGCSRATLKQAARLIEREGLLRVRRGSHGGYFAARPDAGTIEATVSSHLETLEVEPEDATILASALWVEAMRKAAAADTAAVALVVDRLRRRLTRLRDGASFTAVRDIELAVQAEVFALARSRYIQLIFDINTAFFRRSFVEPPPDDDGEDHRAFVLRWRTAKEMELNALSLHDADLAAMAGRLSRTLWHDRVRERLSNR